MKKIFILISFFMTCLACAQTETIPGKLVVGNTPEVTTTDSLIVRNAAGLFQHIKFTDLKTQLNVPGNFYDIGVNGYGSVSYTPIGGVTLGDHWLGLDTALKNLQNDVAVNDAKVTFPGFTSLLTDYSFTDNSTNWNTAFGWGDWSTGVDKAFVDALGVNAATIDNNAVSNSKLALMNPNTFKGRISALPGQVEDLTAAQARTILNVVEGAHTTNTNTQLSIATSAEVNTGTNNTKAISPLALADSQLKVDVDINSAKNEGLLQRVKVSISSAQLLAINTTPIELVAAPGAGKVISPRNIVFNYTYGTTTYVTTAVAVRFVGEVSNIYSTTVIDDTSSGIGSTTKSNHWVFENTAIEFTHPTTDPTTGDGTLEIYITYEIITL